MLGVHHLGLFVASSILLNLTPGQDTLYIVGRSVAQGRRAGIFSALGIQAGCALHTLAAALGLSAVLAASANAYLAVKFAGAAYLAYIGLQMLLQRSQQRNLTDAIAPESDWRLFRAGFFTNVFNPKVALFYLAFLPQFVDPLAPSKIAAFLVLGCIFIGTNTVWCLALAWGSASVAPRARTSMATGHLIKRVTGALFLGLGIKLAFVK
ncbi:MAG: LysE family translocator [Candidatus Hydrogenedentes bacterium]|nr:LysE family translocator [Candidatus Hydrogenedentota bacterium]